MNEEELNSLPPIIQRKEEIICPCCHKPITKMLNYELVIKVNGYDNYGKFENRYKIYYKSNDGWQTKFIGEPYGLGTTNLGEAIEILKKCLERGE